MSQMSNALVVAVFLTAVGSACGSKKDATCEQEGHPGGTVAALWTELGISEGEVCVADPKRLHFIVKKQKNPMEYAQALSSKLDAKGWKPVEGTLNPTVVGKGEDSIMSISGWEHKKGEQTLSMEVSSYPSGIWNDNPVSVALQLR